MLTLALAPLVFGATIPGAALPTQGGRAADTELVSLLSAGREALQGDRPGEAIASFTAARDRFPLVADHAERLRIHAELVSGRMEEVVAAGLRFQREHAASPVAGLVWRDLAAAHRAQGQLEDARRALAEAAQRTRDEEERAELERARASTFEDEVRLEDAARSWLRLWRELPQTEAASPAEARLHRLESRLGRPLRGARDWALRSEHLAQSFHNEEALYATERALGIASQLDGATRRALAERRAELLFRLRRYADAQAAYAALAPTAEHRLARARCLARSGRVDEAVAAFQTLGQEDGGETGARALFLAATLLEDESWEAAEELYRRVSEHMPRSATAQEASWRLGWGAFVRDHFEEAAARLGALARVTPDPIEALRPRYWRARALEALDAAAARAELSALAEAFPFTYYGWRATERLGRQLLPRLAAAPDESRHGSRLSPVRLRRAEVLLAAELREAAELELAALRERVRTTADRIRLASLLVQAHDYHQAQRLIVDAELLRLVRGPGPQRPPGLYTLAWPRAFTALVEPAAARHGAPKALLYAVMREESGYRPEVRSVAGALGLTQIMPTTGARLARELGHTVLEPEQLLDPALNLELGALYLDRLLERMGMRLSAAIASYNAGPRAVGEWLRKRGDGEDDVWVESIPYRQTRSYVKRVLRSVAVYRALYPALREGA